MFMYICFHHDIHISVSALENGTLFEMTNNARVINMSLTTPLIEQYQADEGVAIARGYDSIFDQFSDASDQYNTQRQVFLMDSYTGGSHNQGIWLYMCLIRYRVQSL